jgi:hypothetical protein
MYKLFYLEIIIVFTSIALSFNLFSQTSFVYKYSTLSDEGSTDAIETLDGGFMVTASIGDFSSHMYSTLLIKLNQYGDTVLTKTISVRPETCLIGDLVTASDGNYFGVGIKEFSNGTNLWLLKISPDLDILQDTTYSIGVTGIISYYALVNQYNNLIIYGSASINGSNNHPFIYQLTQAGDSLSYGYYNDSTSSEYVFSMIEKPDISGYFMMILGKYQVPMNNAPGQILTLDYNLNVTGIDSLPRGLSMYYNSKVINNHQFVLTGKKTTSFSPRTDQLGILKLDTSFNVVNEYYLGPDDTISYPGYLHNLDFIDTNNIYYGGTCNQAIADFSSNKSYYMLGNFDSSLNLKWQKYYGGDMYYTLWGLIATSDGGCLLLGSSYDHLTQDMERDIYIIKVDSTGVITSTDETRQATLHDAIVYPNPGKDYLVIESGPQVTGAKMTMTDMNGRQVLNETINGSQININTHSLQEGTYLWQIILRNKVIEAGKWIKY